MTVAIRLTCDAGPCPSYVATAIKTGAFDDSVMVSDGRFLVETTWTDLPEGWTLDPDGRALCPAHAAAEGAEQ